MRFEIILSVLLSFPLSILFFMLLSRNIVAHLKSLREKLSFFFWPYPPERMLIVQELDGEVNIYYDGDYEEIQSENKVLIKTIDGQQYITEIAPSEASINVSMFDAKAPSGYFSPFALAWRWAVAAAIGIYFIYYALVVSWLPPIVTETIYVGGHAYTIARQMSVDPFEALVTTTLFFSMLTWYLSNIMRMNDRVIKYAMYHAKGINPPHVSIIPIPGQSSVSTLEYLEKLGRKIEVVIPEESSRILSRIIGEIEKKTGSKSLAAILLAKLAVAKTWRQALATVLRERFDFKKAGEAYAMIRLQTQPLTKRMIPLLLVVGIICFMLGYALGNVFSVSVSPVTNTTTMTTSMQQHIITPTQPAQTTTVLPTITTTQPAPTITAPQPPPPPR